MCDWSCPIFYALVSKFMTAVCVLYQIIHHQKFVKTHVREVEINILPVKLRNKLCWLVTKYVDGIFLVQYKKEKSFWDPEFVFADTILWLIPSKKLAVKRSSQFVAYCQLLWQLSILPDSWDGCFLLE